MDVEESIAGSAVEVVMMFGSHTCQLVSITAPRDVDDGDIAIFLKSTNSSIDRSNTKRFDIPAGQFMNLIDGERASSCFKRCLNSLKLFGLPLNAHSLSIYRNGPIASASGFNGN